MHFVKDGQGFTTTGTNSVKKVDMPDRTIVGATTQVILPLPTIANKARIEDTLLTIKEDKLN